MIFQHTWEKVLSGEKTQTRRLVRPNQLFIHVPPSVGRLSQNGKYKAIYETGKSYAVQPARGQKAVGRIQIAGIWREDVRDISHKDAKAEGFPTKYAFLQVWTNMHDKSLGEWEMVTAYDSLIPNHCPIFLTDRPDERYQAWVIEFRLVGG